MLLLVHCEVFLIHNTYVSITFSPFVDQFLTYLSIGAVKTSPINNVNLTYMLYNFAATLYELFCFLPTCSNFDLNITHSIYLNTYCWLGLIFLAKFFIISFIKSSSMDHILTRGQRPNVTSCYTSKFKSSIL